MPPPGVAAGDALGEAAGDSVGEASGDALVAVVPLGVYVALTEHRFALTEPLALPSAATAKLPVISNAGTFAGLGVGDGLALGDALGLADGLV